MPIKYSKLPELSAQQVNKFWSKVKMQPSGCWEWQGQKSKSGYGRSTLRKGISYRTHRVAYMIYYLTDPTGFFVCHTCDNPACVNPFHLWLGTASDNARDRNKKGRQAQTGGANHYAHKNPARVCKGEKHKWTKTTEQQVREIRQAFADGESQSSIARRLSVSKHIVFYIVHRKSWKHI